MNTNKTAPLSFFHDINPHCACAGLETHLSFSISVDPITLSSLRFLWRGENKGALNPWRNDVQVIMRGVVCGCSVIHNSMERKWTIELNREVVLSPSLLHCSVQLSCTRVRWMELDWARREEDSDVSAHSSSIWQRYSEIPQRAPQDLAFPCVYLREMYACTHRCVSASLSVAGTNPLHWLSTRKCNVGSSTSLKHWNGDCFQWRWQQTALFYCGEALPLPCQGVHYVEKDSQSCKEEAFFYTAEIF